MKKECVFTEYLHIDNRIFGIDVDEEDPGHFLMSVEGGIQFNSLARGKTETIFSIKDFLGRVAEEINEIKKASFADDVGGVDLRTDLPFIREVRTAGEAPEGGLVPWSLDQIGGVVPRIFGIQFIKNSHVFFDSAFL